MKAGSEGDGVNVLHMHFSGSEYALDEQDIKARKHRQKMIAPVIITAIMVFYYLIYFRLLLNIMNGFALKILLGIIPVLLGAATIGVCIERIKEIKGGEEDDLGQY